MIGTIAATRKKSTAHYVVLKSARSANYKKNYTVHARNVKEYVRLRIQTKHLNYVSVV